MAGLSMRRESRNLYDAMAARLARSTLRDRFSVAFNAETSHWEIGFNKLSKDEFKAILAVPVRVAPANWDFGGNAENGQRAIRIRGLTGSQARDFTGPWQCGFKIENDLPLSNASA